MGDFKVKSALKKNENSRFIQAIIRDVEALDFLIKENAFESGIQRIGAEQELCLLDRSFMPSKKGPDILKKIEDPRYTTELGKYNLEINLDPFELKDDCFSKSYEQLISLLDLGQGVANEYKTRILLTGILQTLRLDHLRKSYMTPVGRYELLSETIKEIRGGNLQIHIHGVDELIAELDSVLFEACNTSFQLHLQIDPKDFVRKYNIAQLISGPVLAASVNSPLLFGRELWQETRIVLFQQSIDTRSSKNHLREKQPRVFFGQDWLKDSPSEIFKNVISRYPLLLTSPQVEDPFEVIKKGKTPRLKAMQTFSGTIYTWNRPCYGLSADAPHLRIGKQVYSFRTNS